MDLRAAAGGGYKSEWALFCDYTAATGQPALPTTLEAVTGFLADAPTAATTRARRVRAIAAAHRRAGHLLERPVLGAAPQVAVPPPPPGADEQSRGGTDGEGEPSSAGGRDEADPRRLVAACPARGWTAGLWGRRDAVLVVLTAHLGYTLTATRVITTSDIDFRPLGGDKARPVIAGRVVPIADDARTCAACAVVRWLEALADLDGLGRGSARKTLTEARAPTAQHHQHSPTGSARWRAAAQLLPAIDQHGWHDDYRPMTTRALRSRLDLARARAKQIPLGGDNGPRRKPEADLTRPRTASPSARRVGDLAEVLSALDAVAEDAEALNARIEALLESR